MAAQANRVLSMEEAPSFDAAGLDRRAQPFKGLGPSGRRELARLLVAEIKNAVGDGEDAAVQLQSAVRLALAYPWEGAQILEGASAAPPLHRPESGAVELGMLVTNLVARAAEQVEPISEELA